MKIVGINASPKREKSQTRLLVMGVLEGARKAGADVTFVDICSLDIKYCSACGTCYATGECIHDDDFPLLFLKLMEADGIVLGSPNYINSVTAQLKTMFDRMADSIQRAARLIPADQALRALPQVVLSSNAAFYFCQGQAVTARPLPAAGGWARVYQDGGRFLGLGAEEDGQLAPRRLLHATEEPEMTQKTVEADPPRG